MAKVRRSSAAGPPLFDRSPSDCRDLKLGIPRVNAMKLSPIKHQQRYFDVWQEAALQLRPTLVIACYHQEPNLRAPIGTRMCYAPPGIRTNRVSQSEIGNAQYVPIGVCSLILQQAHSCSARSLAGRIAPLHSRVEQSRRCRRKRGRDPGQREQNGVCNRRQGRSS